MAEGTGGGGARWAVHAARGPSRGLSRAARSGTRTLARASRTRGLLRDMRVDLLAILVKLRRRETGLSRLLELLLSAPLLRGRHGCSGVVEVRAAEAGQTGRARRVFWPAGKRASMLGWGFQKANSSSSRPSSSTRLDTHRGRTIRGVADLNSAYNVSRSCRLSAHKAGLTRRRAGHPHSHALCQNVPASTNRAPPPCTWTPSRNSGLLRKGGERIKPRRHCEQASRVAWKVAAGQPILRCACMPLPATGFPILPQAASMAWHQHGIHFPWTQLQVLAKPLVHTQVLVDRGSSYPRVACTCAH